MSSDRVRVIITPEVDGPQYVCGRCVGLVQYQLALDKRQRELEQYAQMLDVRSTRLDDRERNMYVNFKDMQHQINVKQKNLDDDKSYLIGRERFIENREVTLLDREQMFKEDISHNIRVARTTSGTSNTILEDDQSISDTSSTASQRYSSLTRRYSSQSLNSSPPSRTAHSLLCYTRNHSLQSPSPRLSPHSARSLQSYNQQFGPSPVRLNRHHSDSMYPDIQRSSTPTPHQLQHQRYYRTSEHNPLINQLSHIK